MVQVEASSTSELSSHSFLDSFWDYAPREQVERQLLTLFRRQLSTAIRARAFRTRIPSALLSPTARFTRAEVQGLPLLSKRELRALGPDDLLPVPDMVFHMVRGTGGTTGLPVAVCWTIADWSAAIQAIQRFCLPLQRLRPGWRLWNGYNQAHVSGPAFDDLARALGGTPIPRHYKLSDSEALEEIERMRADALVVTPQSGSGKGGSLEDLLAAGPHFLARLQIKALLVSSTPLARDVLEEVREQGVSTVINLYGSTEAPPAAISCEADPLMFHLSQGHVFVEVVNADGQHVQSGERGFVVVSRIGSVDTRGSGLEQTTDGATLQPSLGTQLLRYVVGDTALYVDEPCKCGRTSARIRDITRSTNVEDKLKGGCEQWD